MQAWSLHEIGCNLLFIGITQSIFTVQLSLSPPEQRHAGKDREILNKRKAVYELAKSKNPNRWSGDIRNWNPVKEVALNPEKQKTKSEEKMRA